MVQQTDSKFSEYVLANSETGFLKHDKNTALRDLQNENRNTMHKSDERSQLKDNEPPARVSLSGIKRPQPESTMRSHQQKPPASNNGHLVYYVRRKTESEQHKNSTCNNKSNDEKNNEEYPINNSTICNPEPKPTPLVVLDSGKSDITLPAADSKGLSIQQWQERYFRLQNFLKALDLSNQDDYRQMLHSLTSVGLSRVAVELEKRSIQLSMEEAREVQRAKLVLENTGQ